MLPISIRFSVIKCVVTMIAAMGSLIRSGDLLKRAASISQMAFDFSLAPRVNRVILEEVRAAIPDQQASLTSEGSIIHVRIGNLPAT